MAVFVHNQIMVVVKRHGQAENFLQEPMYGGGMEKIATAHDMGDPLQRIVDDDREMIARGRFLARNDGIAPARRVSTRA